LHIKRHAEEVHFDPANCIGLEARTTDETCNIVLGVANWGATSSLEKFVTRMGEWQFKEVELLILTYELEIRVVSELCGKLRRSEIFRSVREDVPEKPYILFGFGT